MKRFLTILLTTLALTAALCVSASASSFDSVAEELSAIGMFRGGANGFDLDQAPTRGQAAIMLVRLYGAEQNAQNTYASGRITCPFTDVSETVAPYVAWLADEGLASGTSATTFGASDPCTAKAYTIFLLRALGYKDDTDFNVVNAQDFAASIGLLDTSALTGTFLRDDLAALTYQALGTNLKDGSTYLLDHLIKEGIIKANDAYPIVDKIEKARALNASAADMSKGLDTGIKMDMAVTVSNQKINGQASDRIEQENVSAEGKIQMLLSSLDPQMAIDLKVKSNFETEDIKVWIKDGWMYMQSGEESVKTELPEAYTELLSSDMMTNSSSTGFLPFVKSITEEGSGTDKSYTIEPNEAFAKLMNSLITTVLKESGMSEMMTMNFKVDHFTMKYNVKGSSLKSVQVTAGLTVDTSVDAGEGKQSSMTQGISMNMEMTINKTGNAVKITYPKLDDFKEIVGGADGPTAIYGATVLP